MMFFLFGMKVDIYKTENDQNRIKTKQTGTDD